MNKEIQDLIDISRYYGTNKDFTIAGGGNTSYKDEYRLWVKASGTSLADIDENGFVVLDRSKLALITKQSFSIDPELREKQVKQALYAACVDPESGLRPSVETNLHDVIEYQYVVHMHPTLVNALMCGKDSEKLSSELFENALYIPYTDPGYTLFKKVHDEIISYKEAHKVDPQIIFLENHGVFVGADSTDEIRKIYDQIISVLSSHVETAIDVEPLKSPDNIVEFIPAIRMLFSGSGLKTCTLRNNKLIEKYAASKESFAKISAPFTPDIIVYCKSNFLYIENSDNPRSIIEEVTEKLLGFTQKHGYQPKILVIKNLGLLAIDDTWQGANTCLDVYEDLIKISFYAENFGGPRFMTERQIAFIDNWEVEHYRRKVAQGSGASQGKVFGRTAVVTGGALGFGAGIVESLISEGANVVIADINKKDGPSLAKSLSKGRKNKAHFVFTNVSLPESLKESVKDTVEQFGGIDLFISNAGILYAGSLEEMEPEIFSRMTKVNFEAYYYCAKYASAIMKLQNKYKEDHFTDIIQINSKSGLAGSNKNFAYAGGKFGGIGLTQSFALELMPFNIKVNSVCPGNFFEGPLWSDPEKGLFTQYLNAGKVPGAKTIADVKKHYENQVPARRGCRVQDVTRAIYYLVEQEYETGQAVPVTGGQIMLH